MKLKNTNQHAYVIEAMGRLEQAFIIACAKEITSSINPLLTVINNQLIKIDTNYKS
jgi:hypothetical protein